MSQERLERVGEAMQRYIDADLVPGTVTLIARRGKIVHFEPRGENFLEEDRAMGQDTIFRIASMTKPITSVALMMLFEEGRFLLTDPISKWLPLKRPRVLSRPARPSKINPGCRENWERCISRPR